MNENYYIYAAVLIAAALIYKAYKKKKDKKSDDAPAEFGVVGFTSDYKKQVNVTIDRIKQHSKYGPLWKKHVKLVKYNPVQRYEKDHKGKKVPVYGDATAHLNKIVLYKVAYDAPKGTGQDISNFIGMVLCHEFMHIYLKEWQHTDDLYSQSLKMQKACGFR